MTAPLPFGSWVRRRRRALDLTQQELGALVGCAAITVRKVESGERRPSRQLADRFADVLGIGLDERGRFVAAARSWSAPPHLDPAVDPAPPAPLPAPLTELVGRERECIDIAGLLAVTGGPARLVTVTGAPGVGKTRLAVEVARRVGWEHDVPPAFVPLAAETEPAEILEHLATAYSIAGIPGVARPVALRERLRQQAAFAVLDNLEQLAGAGEVVAKLLEDCPDLVCLCTSRTRLDVYGEYEFPLAPLDVDGSGGVPGPAVTLFVERCRAVGRRASVAADLTAVADICRRLDGLPLAIELAARRTRDLTLAELGEALGQGLAVLDAGGTVRDPRHDTMRSTIAWSYAVLAPVDQQVLRSLGATAGSIAVDAVPAVAGISTEQASRALAALEAASLLSRRGGRVRMLEVLRDFAEEQLRTEGEESVVRDRMAAYLTDLAERQMGDLEEWPDARTARWLETEDANLRNALRWTLLGPGHRDVGQRLLRAVGGHWYLHGRSADVRRWIDVALDDEVPPEVAEPLLVLDAQVAWAGGDNARAVRRLDQADAVGARLQGAWRPEALGLRAMMHIVQGDLDTATALLERSLATATRQGSTLGRAMSHLRLGRVALLRGDPVEAERHLERAMSRFGEVGSRWGVANATGSLAEAALARGDTSTAIAHGLDAVEGMVAAGADAYAVFRLTTVANALTSAGRHEDAARIAGVVEEWREHLGVPVFPVAAAPYAAHRARTRAALGHELRVTAAEGRLLPRDPGHLRRLLDTGT